MTIPRYLVRSCVRLVPLAVILLAGHAAGQALPGHQRTQEIPLKSGWNAVFLEVEPADSTPAKVFAGLPVDRVATLFESPVANEFVTDPGVNLFKGGGWAVWYAPGLPEAFLKSLDAIQGGRAYLIHARQACRWQPVGRSMDSAPRWRSDAFNFVGFPVKSPGGPTFAEFFAGSKAHRGQIIYRLVDGRWKKVLQSSAESMLSGEAFWIYCKGGSDYQGPLRVETGTRAGILLGGGPGKLVLRNESTHPLAAVVEQVPGNSPPPPLSFLIRILGDPADPVTQSAVRMPAGAWQQALPPIETGAAFALPLECRRLEMSQPDQSSLLKITTDIGTVSWVSVHAYRDDLGN